MNFPSIKIVGQAVCALLVLQLTSGCTSKDPGTASQAYKGVINLEAIRLGFPEESAKSAILSFATDPSVTAPFSQYLSRTYDQNGGQYCLAYENGNPKQLRVVYSQKPISKEEALAKIKNLLPTTAGEETKVDDAEVKAGKKDSPVETHFYGNNLKTEIIYADKAATSVKVVSLYSVAKKPTVDKASTAASESPATGSSQ